MASIIVWALGYFPHNEELDNQAQQEQSYIGRIGKTIEPIFTPQGFDWKLDVGLVSGVGAKEIVASTMGVLYSNNDSFSDDQDYNDEDGKYEVLKKQMTSDLKKTYGYSEGNAHRLLFPPLCIALLPLHRHHRCHQGRDGQLEMGRLRRRLHHAPGMGSISPGLPDRMFVYLIKVSALRKQTKRAHNT